MNCTILFFIRFTVQLVVKLPCMFHSVYGIYYSVYRLCDYVLFYVPFMCYSLYCSRIFVNSITATGCQPICSLIIIIIIIIIIPVWNTDYNFFVTQRPRMNQGLLSIEASRSYGGTPLDEWQPDSETPTWQDTTLTIDRHLCPGGIRTRGPRIWAASDVCLRPRSHCDLL